jgi:hypothetical protein
MDDHEGPRVVPGRYPGEAIRLHQGRHHSRWRMRRNGLALRRNAARQERLVGVDSFHHPKAGTIRPLWSGDPSTYAFVQALYTIELSEQN